MRPVTICLACLLLAVPIARADDVPALIKQLKDKDDIVRLKAAKSLGKLGADAKEAVPALKEATKDDDADVRSVAKQALEKIEEAVAVDKRKGSFDELEKQLKAAKEKDPDVRQKAATGLAKLLADPDDIIRLKAARALGDLGIDGKAAMDALAVASKDSDEGVRRLARRSLDQIRDAVDAEKLAKLLESIRPVLKDLKDKDPKKRVKAAEQLGDMGKEVSRFTGPALVEAMMDKAPAVQNAASEAFERMDARVHKHVLTLLIGQGKSAGVRELAALGSEAKAALPAIVYYYRSQLAASTSDEPCHVLEAMVKIDSQDKTVVQLVVAAITVPKVLQGGPRKDKRHPQHAIEVRVRQTAIHLLADCAVETDSRVATLLSVLEDPIFTIQAMYELGKIGTDAKDAIPALIKFKSNPSDALRDAAVKALEKIDK